MNAEGLGKNESVPPLRTPNEYRSLIAASIDRPLPKVSLILNDFTNPRTGSGIDVSIHDERGTKIGSMSLALRGTGDESRAYSAIVGLYEKEKLGYMRAAYAELIPVLVERGLRLSSSTDRHPSIETLWRWLVDAGVARQRIDRAYQYEVL
jgi:hypothetical protein